MKTNKVPLKRCMQVLHRLRDAIQFALPSCRPLTVGDLVSSCQRSCEMMSIPTALHQRPPFPSGCRLPDNWLHYRSLTTSSWCLRFGRARSTLGLLMAKERSGNFKVQACNVKIDKSVSPQLFYNWLSLQRIVTEGDPMHAVCDILPRNVRLFYVCAHSSLCSSA